MLLSIVVPLYNEAEGIRTFHKSVLLPELKSPAVDSFEVIYVNDGSSDDTLHILHQLAKSDRSVRIVNLSRNFGKEIAVTAGISVAMGDATIIMDGDGQHPPSKIPEFIAKWQEGAQVVVGIRNSNQKEGFIKKFGSKLFYKIFNATSGSSITPRSTDYRLIDRAVQQEFGRFTERYRITRGLIDWLGFRREFVEFDSPPRLAGQASYKTSQLIRLALNSFISLSLKPLFAFGWVGLFITFWAFVIGIFIIIEQVLLGDPMNLNFTGSAMLGIFIAFMVGLVLTSQGIMAVYLSHVHAQTQDRPLFVIDHRNSIGIK